jgi:hypothetical protein
VIEENMHPLRALPQMMRDKGRHQCGGFIHGRHHCPAWFHRIVAISLYTPFSTMPSVSANGKP